MSRVCRMRRRRRSRGLATPINPAWRSRTDIDALPIVEQTGLPYASTHAGKMHACGHDGHTSTLVGVAEILKSIESRLPVCVKLIWQPAEEGGGGGNVLCNAGVLDGAHWARGEGDFWIARLAGHAGGDRFDQARRTAGGVGLLCRDICRPGMSRRVSATWR